MLWLPLLFVQTLNKYIIFLKKTYKIFKLISLVSTSAKIGDKKMFELVDKAP